MARASVIVVQSLGYLVDGRIFPAPRSDADDQTVPYITYQTISSVPLNTLDGYTGHDRVRVQIDVHTNTLSDAEVLMHKVKNALNNSAGSPQLDTVETNRDPETRLWRASLDVFISEYIHV